jgi:hypothetical protein
MVCWIWVLALVLPWAQGSSSDAVVQNNIYLAGFIPDLEGQTSDNGVLSAINLALEHINASPKILKSYKMHILWNNTQVRLQYMLRV